MALTLKEENKTAEGTQDILEEKKFDIKLALSIIFAVASTLVLIYVIYTMVFKKETVIIEEYVLPKLTLQEDMEFNGKRVIETGEVVDIEKSLEEDQIIQALKEYGDYEVVIGTTGNQNPFEPFGEIWSASIPTKIEKEDSVSDKKPTVPENKIPVIAPSN